MALRTASHPHSPSRHDALDFPRLSLFHSSIMDRRRFGSARRDHLRRRSPVRKRVSPPATAAPRAKSLKPACPLGTAPERERGRGGPWSRSLSSPLRVSRRRPYPSASTLSE